jgi:hypothetical protein
MEFFLLLYRLAVLSAVILFLAVLAAVV